MSGRGNNIFNGGDIVEPEQLIAPVSELIAKGFLEEVPGEDSDNEFKDFEQGLEQGLDGNLNPNPKPPPPPPPALAESEEQIVAPVSEEDEEVEPAKEETKSEEEVNPLLEETYKPSFLTLEEVKYDFLIEELKKLGVSFKANISKKEAYELWKAAQVNG